ncbi:Lysine-specific histone demethylase 1A, partial [Entomortierella chlamydospora]
ALTAYMHDMANYSSFMPVYDKPILVGYATNHAAELMERLSDSEARIVYLCHLAHYFDALVKDNSPEEGEALWAKVSFMTRWNQDPFTRGSYTSIPVGASPADIEEFQIPVSARVYGQLTGDDDYEHCSNDDGDDDDDDVVGNKSVGLSAAVALMSVNDPETGRVFFAGEHTSLGHFASVQGAILSGRLEASKILGREHSHEH